MNIWKNTRLTIKKKGSKEEKIFIGSIRKVWVSLSLSIHKSARKCEDCSVAYRYEQAASWWNPMSLSLLGLSTFQVKDILYILCYFIYFFLLFFSRDIIFTSKYNETIFFFTKLFIKSYSTKRPFALKLPELTVLSFIAYRLSSKTISARDWELLLLC